MALGCGQCREDIYTGYGILYKLTKGAGGLPILPTESYVPPNSAICDDCWAKFSAAHADQIGITDVITLAEVFAYNSSGLSGRSPSGAMQSTTAGTVNQNFVFVGPIVREALPRAMQIIDQMR